MRSSAEVFGIFDCSIDGPKRETEEASPGCHLGTAPPLIGFPLACFLQCHPAPLVLLLKRSRTEMGIFQI